MLQPGSFSVIQPAFLTLLCGADLTHRITGSLVRNDFPVRDGSRLRLPFRKERALMILVSGKISHC